MRKAKKESLRSGVPKGLDPRSTRWIARAALVLGGSPETPYLCAHGRSGPESRRVLESAVPLGRLRPKSEAEQRELAGAPRSRPAQLQWLARRRSRALLKGRSHSWAFLWPMGGGRAGSGGGPVWVPLSAPRR